MKSQLLTFWICLLAIVQGASAQQNCSDLFFSEYVEGTFNNKAIEIYNPTNQTIDLANYRLVRWNNGSNAYVAQAGQALSASLAPKEAYVFVLDKQDFKPSKTKPMPLFVSTTMLAMPSTTTATMPFRCTE